MKSFGLSQEDAQFATNGQEKSRGQLANRGLPGKWPLNGVRESGAHMFIQCH